MMAIMHSGWLWSIMFACASSANPRFLGASAESAGASRLVRHAGKHERRDSLVLAVADPPDMPLVHKATNSTSLDWVMESSPVRRSANRLNVGTNEFLILATMVILVAVATCLATWEWRQRWNLMTCLSEGKAKGKQSAGPVASPWSWPSRGSQADQQGSGGSPPGGSSSLTLWANLFKLLKMFFTQPDTKLKAYGLALLLVAWWFWREYLWAFKLSYFSADLTNQMTTLTTHKDLSLVYRSMLVYILADIFLGKPTFSIIDPFIDWYTKIELRTFLTKIALDAYLKDPGSAYYHIKLGEAQNGIDNPDQRIAEDSARISDMVVEIFATTMSSIIGCSMWTAVLFQIGGDKVVKICFFFSILRTLVAWLGFGTSIVDARVNLLKRNASMRYGLTRVRDSAEEVALGAGNNCEHNRVLGLYDHIMHSVWALTAVEVRYGASLGFLDIWPSICLWFVLLPLVLKGDIGFGDASRVHMAYEQVSKVFGFLVNNFGTLTELQANTERFSALLQACEESNGGNVGENLIYMDEVPEEMALQLQGLRVHVAGSADECNREEGLTLTCPALQGLLLMGPSGAGKTSV